MASSVGINTQPPSLPSHHFLSRFKSAAIQTDGQLYSNASGENSRGLPGTFQSHSRVEYGLCSCGLDGAAVPPCLVLLPFCPFLDSFSTRQPLVQLLQNVDFHTGRAILTRVSGCAARLTAVPITTIVARVYLISVWRHKHKRQKHSSIFAVFYT